MMALVSVGLSAPGRIVVADPGDPDGTNSRPGARQATEAQGAVAAAIAGLRTGGDQSSPSDSFLVWLDDRENPHQILIAWMPSGMCRFAITPSRMVSQSSIARDSPYTCERLARPRAARGRDAHREG